MNFGTMKDKEWKHERRKMGTKREGSRNGGGFLKERKRGGGGRGFVICVCVYVKNEIVCFMTSTNEINQYKLPKKNI